MSKAPFYSRQCGDFASDGALLNWTQIASDEARSEGATWLRVSRHDQLGLALVEGWYSRPANPPPARFHVRGETGNDKAEATRGA